MSDFWKTVIGFVLVIGAVLAFTWKDPYTPLYHDNGSQIRNQGK